MSSKTHNFVYNNGVETITSLVEKYELELRINVPVTMRDGVKLSTDLFLPKGLKRAPVILSRTPYGNSDTDRTERLLWFARRGFAVAFQDCRGRYDSEGDWQPFRHERNDGLDTIHWLANQDFCNGSVGITGRSYEGYCCWMVAFDAHPALKAMIPIVPLPDPVINVPYQDGVLFWNMIVWGLMVHGRTNQNCAAVNWPPLYTHLPLRDLDRAAGMESDTWQSWCDHPTFDAWWREVCYMHNWNKVDIPALHICGWYDDDGISTYKNYPAMRLQAKSEFAREHQHLLVGCWPHKTNKSSVVGELDFGPQALIDLNAVMLRFFAKHLAGEDHYPSAPKRCQLFIMGENRWHGFNDWPIPGAISTKYYLHSNGSANTALGDGLLSTEFPADKEPADKYVYNPEYPTPYVTDPVALQLGEACDQQAIERRPDVLVYTTPPLEKDVVVCGRIFVELYFSTDVKGTDFVGKLVDVYPNGRAIQVSDGIRRAEFRNSLEQAEYLEQDKVYQLTIDLWATGLRFLKGHSIRLEITSSAVPKFCRHLNTDTPQADETQWKIANQVIWHNKEYPSCLILDVIPEKELENTEIVTCI